MKALSKSKTVFRSIWSCMKVPFMFLVYLTKLKKQTSANIGLADTFIYTGNTLSIQWKIDSLILLWIDSRGFFSSNLGSVSFIADGPEEIRYWFINGTKRQRGALLINPIEIQINIPEEPLALTDTLTRTTSRAIKHSRKMIRHSSVFENTVPLRAELNVMGTSFTEPKVEDLINHTALINIQPS